VGPAGCQQAAHRNPRIVHCGGNSTYLAATLTIRDAEHRRWQSYSATHGVYWTLYGERPGHIIILSRFKLGED